MNAKLLNPKLLYKQNAKNIELKKRVVAYLIWNKMEKKVVLHMLQMEFIGLLEHIGENIRHFVCWDIGLYWG